MPNPHQPVLGSSGKPCLRQDGRPVVADPNGQAACACSTECPFYYKATSCNPGTCRVVLDIYFCGTFQCDAQSGNGPPLDGQIVRVTNDDLCYVVDTDIKYSAVDPPPSGQQPLPSGARIIPLADLSCALPTAQCEDCSPQSGFYPAKPCGCSQGTTSGVSIWIECQCWANAPYPCPVYRYVDPISGQTSCWTKADGPAVEELPPGGVNVCGFAYPDCCTCCQPQCCSCTDNYPPGTGANCQSRTYRHSAQSVTTDTRPYGCCWQFGTESAVGSGTVDFFYGPGETHRYRRVQFKASGHTLTVIDTAFDPNTGETTGVTYDYETVDGCLIGVPFANLTIVRSSFGNGAIFPNTSNGSIVERCDLYSWNFVNDATQNGGQYIKGSGSIGIVASAGFCNGQPCGNGSLGDNARGCSGCGSIAGAEAAMDL